MPASLTQLTGGLFQDADGVVLVSGYLVFELSQDEQVVGLNTEVCAGLKIKINLNSSGSISTTTPQYIWGNNDLLPINSFYIVTGYTSSGQLAWGPNNQQVTSGATFDVGTWVPNLLTNWTPPLQSPMLEHNGTVNGSQAILNLKNGTGVTITDDGLGGITINGQLGVTLKTNGVSNTLQTLLNLLEGNGITLTSNGSGGVAIASASLKTNGIANGSQKILNLKNGTNITITDDGVGGITIAATSLSLSPLPRPDVKYFAIYRPYSSSGSQLFVSALGDSGLTLGSGAGIGGATIATFAADATHGPGWTLACTGSGASGFETIQGTSKVWSGRSFKFIARISLPTVAPTCNFFVGLSDNSGLNTTNSVLNLHNLVGFLFNSSLDSHWRTMTGNTSSTNIAATTITGDATPHLLQIDYTPGVSAVFSIDGIVVSTLSSVPDLPSATVGMIVVAMINPYGNVAVGLNVEGLYWEQASS